MKVRNDRFWTVFRKNRETKRMDLLKLKNGRLLGSRIYEISSVPDYEVIAEQEEEAQRLNETMFFQMVTEIYRFCKPGSTVLELLWTVETKEDQGGQIHIYLVLRMISENREDLKKRMGIVQENVRMRLQSLGFQIQEETYEHLKMTERLPDEHAVMNAVVKSEQYRVHEQGILPYYFVRPMLCHSTSGFQMLADTLLRVRGGAVAIQLLPDVMNYAEMAAVEEFYKVLRQINTMRGYQDAMSDNVYREYEWLHENLSQPMFRYNILAMGDTWQCATLTAQLVSILKGTDSAQYQTVSLTRETISVKRDFLYYPWNLNQKLINYYRNVTVMRALQCTPQIQMLYRLPYFIFAQEATALFRLPLGDHKISGIRVKEIVQRTQDLDERVLRMDNIKFGRLPEKEQGSGWIGCTLDTLTRHTLIVGMPGTGKTTFSVHLLLQMYERGIPFLAIEPTKTEYRALIDRIPDLQIFTPGKNRVSPFVINPFLPPRGITVEQYLPSLLSAFQAAFSMPSPLDTIFQQAVQEAYALYGWRDYSTVEDPDVKKFGLYEFIQVFRRLIARQKYSAEVKGNLMTGGIFRLRELIHQNPNIYDTVESVPLDDLLCAPTILELNAIDNEEQKSVLIALLLIQIYVYTKQNHRGDGKLKNLLLIDEAHVLFKARQGSKEGENLAVHSLENMLAEIRSYGTGIVIADQSPAAVGNEVIKNTDIKMIFRLVDSNDRKVIADTTNMSELMRKHISKLETGQAFYSVSALHEPVLIQTPDIRKEEGIRLNVSDSEIRERTVYWNNHQQYLIPYEECRYSSVCRKCSVKIRSDAAFFSERFYMEFRDRILDLASMCRYMNGVSQWLERQNLSGGEKQNTQLYNCVKIRYLRKVLQEKEFRLSEKDREKILKALIQ